MASEKDRDDVLSLESDEDSDFSGFEPLNPDDVAHVAKQVSVPSSVDKKKGKASAKTAQSQNDNSASSVTKNLTKNGPQNDSVARNVGSAKANSRQKGSSKASSKPKKPKPKTLDLDNLSQDDIMKLRQIMGIEVVEPSGSHEMAQEEDLHYVFGDSLQNLPNVHVEIENDGPSSDVEVIQMADNSSNRPLRSIENEINNALFDNQPQENVQNVPCFARDRNEVVGGEDFRWNLPKLKVPQRGEPISQSLAELINAACTSQCDTDDIVSKYKLPSNCDKLAPPLINAEIWSEIHKKVQTYDKAFRDIQSLIASGLLPIVKLLDVLRDQIQSNASARDLISDSITLLGQAQFNLSLRRRYMVRPYLKKKYSNLCNINTPITTLLFGDDVQKEIKKCDTGMSVTKEPYAPYGSYGPQQRMRGRARGRGGPQRGYRGYGQFQAGRGYNRYHPYGGFHYGAQPTQYTQYRYPTQYQIPKKSKKTATVTSPEDMAS